MEHNIPLRYCNGVTSNGAPSAIHAGVITPYELTDLAGYKTLYY